MKKVMLGVSLYPEQETLEEIDAYLKKASTYGFKKVFTSMFSVPGTKEEIIAYFKDFTKIVHKYGMIVSGDCNSELFHRLEATETDLSVFKDIGVDILRMKGMPLLLIIKKALKLKCLQVLLMSLKQLLKMELNQKIFLHVIISIQKDIRLQV